MSESIVPMLLGLRQAWCHDQYPREPVPVSKHPLGEETLLQLHAVPAGHVSVTREKLTKPI